MKRRLGQATRGVACGASLALLVTGCATEPRMHGHIAEGALTGGMAGLFCGPFIPVCVPAGIVLGAAAGVVAEVAHNTFQPGPPRPRPSSNTPNTYQQQLMAYKAAPPLALRDPNTEVIFGVTFVQTPTSQVLVTDISSDATSLRSGDRITHCNDGSVLRLTQVSELEKCRNDSGKFEFRVYRDNEFTTAEMRYPTVHGP